MQYNVIHNKFCIKDLMGSQKLYWPQHLPKNSCVRTQPLTFLLMLAVVCMSMLLQRPYATLLIPYHRNQPHPSILPYIQLWAMRSCTAWSCSIPSVWCTHVSWLSGRLNYWLPSHTRSDPPTHLDGLLGSIHSILQELISDPSLHVLISPFQCSSLFRDMLRLLLYYWACGPLLSHTQPTHSLGCLGYFISHPSLMCLVLLTCADVCSQNELMNGLLITSCAQPKIIRKRMHISWSP